MATQKIENTVENKKRQPSELLYKVNVSPLNTLLTAQILLQFIQVIENLTKDVALVQAIHFIKKSDNEYIVLSQEKLDYFASISKTDTDYFLYFHLQPPAYFKIKDELTLVPAISSENAPDSSLSEASALFFAVLATIGPLLQDQKVWLRTDNQTIDIDKDSIKQYVTKVFKIAKNRA